MHSSKLYRVKDMVYILFCPVLGHIHPYTYDKSMKDRRNQSILEYHHFFEWLVAGSMG